jgi:hypothetical protein
LQTLHSMVDNAPYVALPFRLYNYCDRFRVDGIRKKMVASSTIVLVPLRVLQMSCRTI